MLRVLEMKDNREALQTFLAPLSNRKRDLASLFVHKQIVATFQTHISTKVLMFGLCYYLFSSSRPAPRVGFIMCRKSSTGLVSAWTTYRQSYFI